MLLKMFVFEWRFFVRQPSFYVIGLIFFTLAFLAATLNQVNMGGGNTYKNGPFLIGQIMVFFSFLSMFLVVNFVANTATRNHSTQMEELLLCKPFNPFYYQAGRFLGAFAVAATVFFAAPVGLLLGSLMPWVDTARFGPVVLDYYISAYFHLSLPTLFVFSCLFYSLARRFKSIFAAYLSAVIVFMVYELSSDVFDGPSSRTLQALLDPFAITSFAEVTRYWTVVEKNTQAITLSGVLLQNRLIWIGVGFAAIIFFGGLFRSLSPNFKSKKKAKLDVKETVPVVLDEQITHQGVNDAGWQQFFARTRFEIRQVLFNPAFVVLALIAIFVSIGRLTEPQGMFGTAIWPVTQIMVEVVQGTMGFLILIVMTYYSAEIVWRERNSGIGDIVDSMPVSNLSFWLSKLIAMWSIVIVLLCLGLLVTVLFQLGTGFTDIDLWQYLVSLMYFNALPWAMLAVLAFFLQVLSPNKYVGMFLFVLYILSRLVLEPVGIYHHMFRFSQSPGLTYSDLNTYDLTLLSHSWYMLYWLAFSLILSVFAYGVWHRGPQQSLRHRLKQLSYQIGVSGRTTILLSFVVFMASGCVIYYNTRVLNEFVSPKEMAGKQASYEKEFSQYANAPIPSIISVDAQVDIFPDQRKIEASAQIIVENKTNYPIERFLVSMPEYVSPELIVEIADGQLGQRNEVLNTYWFEFGQALQPGEQRQGRFKVTRQTQGFVDRDEDLNVVRNGTFINNIELFPRFGYLTEYELIDPNDRRRYELPPPKRANKLEDSRYYRESTLRTASGFIRFEATVSTAEDQIAIAPGYLVKQWQDNGRRYFHYKMDNPIDNYYAFLSARLDVVKEDYNGVAIEVYYHPEHDMNIDRMVSAIKDSIDYYSRNFGPYQHRQARIVEFPGYQVFAQSFANTIPYSERIGFIYDIRDEEETDSVYFVTAHEMAHQWWGGQVNSANVQGSAVIVETLAHYSALMVTEKKYGIATTRHILMYELDRYLQGRSRESVTELPLMRAEDQNYIHYRKGVVVMASLRDLLGEQRLNDALKGFLNAYKYKSEPYPTTLDLKSYIEKGANEQERAFIASVFEKITLYDLKAKQASLIPLDDGSFEVSFSFDAYKYQADGQGVETKVDLAETLEVGLFSQDPAEITSVDDIIYLQKHTVHEGHNEFKIIVAERPVFAGVDPYVRMIDRDSEDNLIELN